MLASTRPTSKSDRLSWRVKSKLDARCRTNDRHSEHRHLYWLQNRKQNSSARSRQASAANAELHQLECVVPGDAPS
ncbi:hypothetical protein [Microcoleus sp. PH2017_05_CCC_O_A]|uniref:hypothetical protein n=1 Tax=Microcoleus sp. PH2017_05_CCC_O_A TaxID=2798816 RepID=UPI001DB4422D|nr:hypothetical protein [Microcoleus sp. PH2017_05_CCC_O_A]MCC3434382.1 hypothetical protein [Microcoleus sp. PH2017_05_CCC_O_A]